MNQNRLDANRKNALKSTGPKTPNGKATSSRNALKHGVLTATPILVGLESRKAWERHRDGVLKSISPVGYIEELLTNRIAVISWKLWRVDRYEAEVAAAAVAAAELDLEDRAEPGCGKPPDPAKARARAAEAYLVGETLETLPNLTDGDRLDTQAAVATLWALLRETPDNVLDIPIPGIPDDDAEFNAFDHWTAGLLRKGAEVYAAAARITTEALLNKCILSAVKKYHDARQEECELVERGRRWELLLEREIRRRMLLEPNVLATVARYESNLERSFFRTLHEIQILQASRSGAVVPPPAAMDVDLTVRAEGSR